MVRLAPIPFFSPSFDSIEEIAVRRFFLQDNDSEYAVENFEKQFQTLFKNGLEFFAVKSGTIALYLSLLSLSIKPKDEVITSCVVCPAVLNAIEQAGAKVVLVDVEPTHATIDYNALCKAITPHTRAIIAVHYNGVPCCIDAIVSLCRHHGICLIEDCAQSLGAKFHDKMCGTFGDIAIFSFYANKIITCAEGGGILASPAVIQSLRALCYSKESLLNEQNFASNGHLKYPFIMDDLMAVLASIQLTKLNNFHHKRKAVFTEYNHFLSGCPFLIVPHFSSFLYPSFYQYVIEVLPHAKFKDVKALAEKLRTVGVLTYPDFYPTYKLKFYKDKYHYHDTAYFPNAESIMNHRLCLPCYVGLSQKDVKYISEALKSFLSL